MRRQGRRSPGSTVAARFRAGLLALLAAGGWCCDPLDLRLFEPVSDAGAFGGTAQAGASGADAPDGGSGGDDLGSAGAAGAPDAAGPTAPTCLPMASECEACVQRADCEDGLRCHPSTGDCVTACDARSPVCPDDRVCNTALGVCVSCASDDDCAAEDDRERCDVLRGVCVECIENEDCASDDDEPVCLPGLAVCGCITPDDCPGGFCDYDELRCEDD